MLPSTPGVRPSISGQSGMALMPIILAIAIAGALIGVGLQMLGPVSQRMRMEATRQMLERASRSVIAWSVARGRLPDAGEFAAAAGVRNDID